MQFFTVIRMEKVFQGFAHYLFRPEPRYRFRHGIYLLYDQTFERADKDHIPRIPEEFFVPFLGFLHPVIGASLFGYILHQGFNDIPAVVRVLFHGRIVDHIFVLPFQGPERVLIIPQLPRFVQPVPDGIFLLAVNDELAQRLPDNLRRWHIDLDNIQETLVSRNDNPVTGSVLEIPYVHVLDKAFEYLTVML